MDKIKEFHNDRKIAIEKMAHDINVKKCTENWELSVAKYDYVYNMTWMGVPILQLTTDMIAIQEIIWKVKPDLIIETGLAYGGSIIFSASMLELLGNDGEVIGVDIDIREHNRKAIENHPMFKRITLLEGSSVDNKIVSQVTDIAKNKEKVLIILDSNHTHDHVLMELRNYAPLVSKESYIIVMDTNIEKYHEIVSQGRESRPWGVGNNPWTAVQAFLKEDNTFEVDETITDKIVITSAPGGYLKKLNK